MHDDEHIEGSTGRAGKPQLCHFHWDRTPGPVRSADCPAGKGPSVCGDHRQQCGTALRCCGTGKSGAAGVSGDDDYHPCRRAQQELAGGGTDSHSATGAEVSSRQQCHRPGRWCGRRSGRFCGQHLSAGCRVLPDSHVAVGTGGQQRRRQGGGESCAGKKYDWRILSAAAGAD